MAFSPFLVIAGTLRDEQDLTTGMTMAIELCSGVIGCDSNHGIEHGVTATWIFRRLTADQQLEN
jgi:hypothetical protein